MRIHLPLKKTKNPSLYCDSKQETHNLTLGQNNRLTTQHPKAKQHNHPSLHKSRSFVTRTRTEESRLWSCFRALHLTFFYSKSAVSDVRYLSCLLITALTHLQIPVMVFAKQLKEPEYRLHNQDFR